MPGIVLGVALEQATWSIYNGGTCARRWFPFFLKQG